MAHRYVLIGGGLASMAAIEGIRSRDRDGSILLISRENHRPYDRPSLTKDLWSGAIDLERLPLRPDAWYAEQGVDVELRREVVEIDPERRVLWDDRGDEHAYGDLLIATGCRPRRLQAPGSEQRGVRYFRDLEDYLDLESRLPFLQHATILGGGFTGLELTSALRSRNIGVTLMLPDELPLERMLPRDLGERLLEDLRGHDVEVVTSTTLAAIESGGEVLHARTPGGDQLSTQLVLVDLGGEALTELAEAAGLDTDAGIVVDEYGATSKPHVWAAGDVAEFPYIPLGQLKRVEGSDHAERHGRTVGANMAGAGEPYTHVPRKWFRVFDRTFEGVGEMSTRLDTEVTWLEPGERAVVLYAWEEVVRGVLLLGAPDRLEWARSWIREARATTAEERSARVRAAT